MSYSMLGQNLHEVAESAKKYFSTQYGAKNFVCEQAPYDKLSLRPTWHAALGGHYLLCIEVRESPFSNTMYQFVTQCASDGLPVKLWIAVPDGLTGPQFSSELKQAREVGVGVLSIGDRGIVHEFHRPVPLSLFGLKKTDFANVPSKHRDTVKTAESTFLDGTPEQGCQFICQALEHISRSFALRALSNGWFHQKSGQTPPSESVIQTVSWAKLLETMETGLDFSSVRTKCNKLTKQLVVRTRGMTESRNSVSHKPKNAKELQSRDAKLRTTYESARDLLIEWFVAVKPIRIT